MITFIVFICKKFNILIIAFIGIIYFLLYLCGFDVAYGSIIFALTHVAAFTTLLYSFYRIVIPKKDNKKQTKDKKAVLKQQKRINKKERNIETSDKNIKTKYYEVKQDPRYVFTEYSDRYELFIKTPDGLKYVKTDYKNKSEKK